MGLAFVLPLLIMVLIGIFWLGRAVSIYQGWPGRLAREPGRRWRRHAQPVEASASDAEAVHCVDDADRRIDTTTGPGDYRRLDQALDPSDPANYQVNGVTVTIAYPMRIPFL